MFRSPPIYRRRDDHLIIEYPIYISTITTKRPIMIFYEFLTINSFVTRSLVISHPASYRPRNSLEGFSIIFEYTGYIIEIELTFS